jgi:hypothetical protein
MVMDFAFKALTSKPFLNWNPVLRNMEGVSRQFFHRFSKRNQKKPGEAFTGSGRR